MAAVSLPRIFGFDRNQVRFRFRIASMALQTLSVSSVNRFIASRDSHTHTAHVHDFEFTFERVPNHLSRQWASVRCTISLLVDFVQLFVCIANLNFTMYWSTKTSALRMHFTESLIRTWSPPTERPTDRLTSIIINNNKNKTNNPREGHTEWLFSLRSANESQG